MKIGPQSTQWRLNPAPGPHHVMWATVAGTAESSLTWKSGIRRWCARKCNTVMAKLSQSQKQRAFLLWRRRRECPTVEICAARSPLIRRRRSSLSTPHRAVEVLAVLAAASATSQIGCEMVACVRSSCAGMGRVTFACREQLAAPSTDSANDGLLRKSLGQSAGLLELHRRQQQHQPAPAFRIQGQADRL